MAQPVKRESAVEVFGKAIVELAEYFYRHKAPGKNFWNDLDESEKRNCLLIGAIQSGMEHRTFRDKYDSLIISLSPDKLAAWIEKLSGFSGDLAASIVNSLRNGTAYSIEWAMRSCWHNADRIHNYRELFAFLKETLMRDDAEWQRIYEHNRI